VKFFFDSHWPARRVGLDGMEHKALLNVAQGKGVKIAMEGPINPPVAGGAGRELPTYLSNGVVGLKVRDNPLQNPLHRGSSSKSKLWSAVDMTEAEGSQFLRRRMPTKRSFHCPALHHSKWAKSLSLAGGSLRPASDFTQLSLQKAHPASLLVDGYLFPSPRYTV
jgi:hypothetical protein